MSLKKYLNRKNDRQVIVSMDAFEEKLKADLFSLIVKPNENILEVKKNSLNLKEVVSFFKKYKFPFYFQLETAIRSLNLKKIKKIRQCFSYWNKHKSIKKEEVFHIENLLIQCENDLLKEEITPSQIDTAFNSFFEESKIIIFKLKNKLLESLEKCNLENFSLKLVALESQDYSLNEVKVFLGDFLEFVVEIKDFSFNIKEVSCKEVSNSLQEKAGLFLEEILNPFSKKFINLYFESEDKKFFLNKKKELSLGIQTFIPNYFNFSLIPKQGENIWKIKTESKYFLENEELVLIEELPIKWIEKYEK